MMEKLNMSKMSIDEYIEQKCFSELVPACIYVVHTQIKTPEIINCYTQSANGPYF